MVTSPLIFDMRRGGANSENEGGLTEIMSIVFLMTATALFVAVMSVCSVCIAAIISFMDGCSLALLANSR